MSKKVQSILQILLAIGILVFANILANLRVGGQPFYAQLDMTEEQRYTLTDPTRALLRDLDEVVTVEVLLTGAFPAGFKRLQTAARDMLDDFRGVSGYVEYQFVDPNKGTNEQINQNRKQLAERGVNPVTLRVKDQEGASQKLIYPYAIFYYKGRSMPVRFLENEIPGMPKDVVLNNSVALLEYKFANAIQKLQRKTQPPILFTEGQGELSPLETADLEKTLQEFYETGRIHLDSVTRIGAEAQALIVAKPRFAFSEKDKFKIDQYIMNGGKVLWLLDKLNVDLDSLRGREQFLPQEYPLNIDDLLFNYGIRLEPNLVLDLQCSRIPLATGQMGNAPQFDFFPYPYHPIVAPRSEHPVVKSLDAINLFYPSSLDTEVRTKTEVEKTVLLSSSENSRLQYPPLTMDFRFLQYKLDPDKFNQGRQPLALLLEGTFPSMYENRVTQSLLTGLQELGQEFKTRSTPTRMLVVGDGDVARNGIDRKQQAAQPLGYNPYERYRFANKDFLVNALEYLIDDRGLIEARGKEVKLRMLDTKKAESERLFWQVFNLGTPLVLLGIFALVYNALRRRRYAGKGSSSTK